MMWMTYKCDVCGCEHKRYIDEACNYDGEIKIYHGKEKEHVYMCPSCTSEVLDFIEKLREDYGFYEEEK